MREQIATTPFGRRQMTLGQITAQMQAAAAVESAGKPGTNQPAVINKWALFRTLTQVKVRLGVSDRSLSVLNALLSFQPETALSLPQLPEDENSGGAGQGGSCDLIVFPSNRALCLRAHGMAEPTLRRHLAALVEAGLILRRDSPNGKRYARRDDSGRERFSDAFGFDLTPLLTRAAEFEALFEELRCERRTLMLVKERISLYRRDVAKLIALGLDEALEGDWEGFRQRFMLLVTPLRRLKTLGAMSDVQIALAALRFDVGKSLEIHTTSGKINANDVQNDRHQSNSNTQSHTELEPSSEEAGPQGGVIRDVPLFGYPLGLILEACPDVTEYHGGGQKIRNWPEFIGAARLLRPMLGISPDAWRDAVGVMGEPRAAIVVASILQRSEHSSEAKNPRAGAGALKCTVNGSPAITSPGGYLRSLTQKARAGEFALGPLLMALIGQRLKAKRVAAD